MFCLATDASSSTAQEPQIAIYTLGQESCGTFVEAYENRINKMDVRLAQFRAFAVGYATAFNLLAPNRFPSGAKTLDVLGGTQVAAQDTFLVTYCRANPFNSFVRALNELFDEL